MKSSRPLKKSCFMPKPPIISTPCAWAPLEHVFDRKSIHPTCHVFTTLLLFDQKRTWPSLRQSIGLVKNPHSTILNKCKQLRLLRPLRASTLLLFILYLLVPKPKEALNPASLYSSHVNPAEPPLVWAPSPPSSGKTKQTNILQLAPPLFGGSLLAL